MKCPYRKITIDNGYAEKGEDFAECYKYECPFYETITKKQRYDGGHNYITVGTCRRVKKESEDTE